MEVIKRLGSFIAGGLLGAGIGAAVAMIVAPQSGEEFVEGVERYSHFHWLHMRKEEDEILPLAAKALSDEDWKAIDTAFLSNEDPIVGVPASKAFRELFRRIVAIAPPPWGVGPEAAPH